jgi:hypothetical protein
MDLRTLLSEKVVRVNHIERRKELLDDRIQRHRETIERYRDKIRIEEDRIKELREQLRGLT